MPQRQIQIFGAMAPNQMLALPKSVNLAMPNHRPCIEFRFKRNKKHRGSSSSSAGVVNIAPSATFDSAKTSSSCFLSSPGSSVASVAWLEEDMSNRAYKSIRSNVDFRTTKSLSASLREFRDRRRSRATKTTVRQTKGLELWDVCEKGLDLSYLEYTIQLYPDLIHLEQRGRTPLFVACANGHANMAAKLLEAGATANDKVYEATDSVECRALLEEYRVVERALSIDGTKGEAEDDSCETPQAANLSSDRKKASPRSTAVTIQEENEEEEESFFQTGREFNACSPFTSRHVIENEKSGDQEDEIEDEIMFWTSRQKQEVPSFAKHAIPPTRSIEDDQEVDPPPSHARPQPELERQKSLLSIAPSDCSEEDDEDQNEDDHAQRNCNCALVACPGFRHDSPVPTDEEQEEEDEQETESPSRPVEPTTRAASFHEEPKQPEQRQSNVIPEILPTPSSHPSRLSFLGRSDDEDNDSPAAVAASSSSSDCSTTTGNGSTQRSSSRSHTGRGQMEISDHSLSSRPPSHTISFSSAETDCSEESIETRRSESVYQNIPLYTSRSAPTVAKQPPFIPDEDAVEQAIECTFVPNESSASRGLMSPWKSFRRNRRSSEEPGEDDDDDDDDTFSQATEEKSTSSSRRKGAAVEMTLNEFKETAVQEEAKRQGFFEFMRKRSQLRRKVSKLLEDTDSFDEDDDDNISGFSERTRSTFFHEECCDPHSCCF